LNLAWTKVRDIQHEGIFDCETRSWAIGIDGRISVIVGAKGCANFEECCGNSSSMEYPWYAAWQIKFSMLENTFWGSNATS